MAAASVRTGPRSSTGRHGAILVSAMALAAGTSIASAAANA